MVEVDKYCLTCCKTKIVAIKQIYSEPIFRDPPSKNLNSSHAKTIYPPEVQKMSETFLTAKMLPSLTCSDQNLKSNISKKAHISKSKLIIKICL